MKAVVMAGGEGNRLRPLTCCTPKPLVKIMGKSVLQYIIELLAKNGFDEIAVTTRYRSEDFDFLLDSIDADLKNIYTVEETRVLGTAGCVKNAAKNWNEPFLAISGDCICDIELSKVMLYHKSIMADLTIVCSNVEKPDEYGTVNLTRNGEIDSFCEKPDWSHASSNLANTGIYVINPSVLDMIPDNVQYDFAAHLFPDMLSNRKKLFGYQTTAYWSDIGDLKSLRKTVKDIMSFKVNLDLPECKNGIFSSNQLPKGNYNVVPPVYFGKNVKVGDYSTIGPYTVLEDNVNISENTRVKKSVIGNNTSISSGCDIIGVMIGSNCLIKSNCVCLEGACIGDESKVGNGSTISNNVLVWPAKNVARRSVMTRNLRDGKNEFDLLTCDGIFGTTFCEVSCESCCRLGEAVAASSFGGKVGIGYDSSRESKALAMAVLSGLISGGSDIADFGECFESQVGYFVSFCEQDCGIYITANASDTKITLFGAYGLPLIRKYERELESRYKRSDFRYSSALSANEIRDMSHLNDVYEGQILSSVGNNISGVNASIVSKNSMINSLAAKCFYISGGKAQTLPVFTVDYTGKKVCVKDEKNKYISYEQLMILVGQHEINNGNDICIRFDAPAYLDKIAEKSDVIVYRVGRSAMTEFPENVAMTAKRNLWAFDALALVFKVLSIMNIQNKSLNALINELPEVCFSEKVVSVDIPHSKIAGRLNIIPDNKSQGLRQVNEKGSVTLVEIGAGRLIKIVAEAATMEAAKELCDFAEKKITHDTIDIYHQ